ncbi:MAG: DEAD/DEAH box helicase [Desulfobulbus sp.]|jgi:superfamily II DNA or RNA helicase|uniref:DEAD/DEAH box helicase n=1 Tax=Desulfobulbus sp. TaxID=895 RepID=UPI00283E2BE9|nr:DEAD/DEAH box helicase [Desulfobulbus sp.]MDR2551367.1 DEAD/DEAH box helicase [Desulfobulbus sp.]
MAGNNGPVPRLAVDRECCLSDAAPELLAAIRAELTIDNPQYQAAKQFGRWIGKKLKPRLFFFREEDGQLFFPRGFGNQAVRLCRRITGLTPIIDDRRRLLPAIDLSFQGSLRPYQEEAVAAMLAHSFGVLEAGTGSGKTVMALAAIARRQQPTLIVVHSKELMRQWQQRIAQFLGLEAGLAGDGILDIRPVTVAIVNTVKKHLDTLPDRFGQLVVDECHRVPATLFTDVVSAFDCTYMLGLSATAFRREDGMTRLIHISMGDRVHAVDNRMLAASGAVIRPVLQQRPTAFSYGYQGEYAKLIKALAANLPRNRLITDDILALLRQDHQGTILVVSDRVAHCRILAELLAGQGVSAPVLTGQSPPEERMGIVADVQAGRVIVLIATVQLIGEGFDCPGLSTLVLATPIKFEGRLLQVVGRIMRPAEGKEARVIDYVDEAVPVLRRSAAARRAVFAEW